MCDRAETLLAAAAVRAAQAEWDLVQSINAELKFHRDVVERTRAVLLERGDRLALDLFDAVTERQPELDAARTLVESAGAAHEEEGG